MNSPNNQIGRPLDRLALIGRELSTVEHALANTDLMHGKNPYEIRQFLFDIGLSKIMKVLGKSFNVDDGTDPVATTVFRKNSARLVATSDTARTLENIPLPPDIKRIERILSSIATNLRIWKRRLIEDDLRDLTGMSLIADQHADYFHTHWIPDQEKIWEAILKKDPIPVGQE